MPAALQLLAWTLVGGWTILKWRKLQKHWRLQHHAGDDYLTNLWTLKSSAGDYIEGKLLRQGYRSAGLLVLVIEADTGRRIFLPVWIDTVTAANFSYLNLQLMYNTRSGI